MEKDSRTLNKFEKQHRKEWNNVDTEQAKEKDKAYSRREVGRPKEGERSTKTSKSVENTKI